jgi:hypothetical protein
VYRSGQNYQRRKASSKAVEEPGTRERAGDKVVDVGPIVGVQICFKKHQHMKGSSKAIEEPGTRERVGKDLGHADM